MSTVRPGVPAPWPLLLAVALAACGGPSEAVRGCSKDSDCGAGAFCVQAACTANRPPAVTLQLPAAPTTNRVLMLGATAVDPDPGDTVARYTWTVTPVGAGCPAEPEPSAGPQLELVFWCAGTYEVAVVAQDQRGAASAPVKQVVDVAQAAGAPVVTAGPQLQVDHLCGGTPFACRPALAGAPVALSLSATATDPAGGPLTTRWRMVPPAGTDPRATVTWARGEASLVNEAWVETPGGVIGGTWRFRLRATSASGLVGQAEQPALVGNRPPVLAGQPFRIDHRHEAGAWLASGTLALPASDPDGDPTTLAASLVETGADGCTSRLGPVTAGSVTFDTRCAEATRLIGLATRTIHVVVTDGSGATAEALFPVEIGNRPPVLRLTSNPAGDRVSVDHSVGACPTGGGSCFLASGTAAFVAEDPDGDPVTSPAVAATLLPGLTASTGAATTALGVATFRFATALTAPAEFRTAAGGSPFSLVATAADPFGATGRLGIPVIIGNRPPVLKRGAASVAVSHRYDRARAAYVAVAPLAAFEDPDGDPLDASGSVGQGPCTAFSLAGGAGQVECSFLYTVAPGRPPLTYLVGDHPVVLAVFDGWESASAATTVSIQNGTPVLNVSPNPVESCVCTCFRLSADSRFCEEWLWKVDRARVPLPMSVQDADGDPVQVTYLPAPASGGQQTAFPAACGASYNLSSGPLTVQITVDDGVAQAQVSTVLAATCSTVNQVCVP